MMPSSLTQNNNSNRVKNIRSKFEVLSEPSKIALKSKFEVSSSDQPKNVKIVKLQNTTTVPINLTKDKHLYLPKLQLCKVNSAPTTKYSSNNVLNSNNPNSKDKFGPPCNFGNRKRLKENVGLHNESQNSSYCTESQPNFLDDPKMPKSLHLKTDVDENAESDDVGKENVSKNEDYRALTRQFSDPTKKLHRSPAFRCDRSEKIRDSRKNSFNSDCSDHSPQPSETDRCKLSKDKLKILGLLLEEKMKQDSFEFSKPKRINKSDENGVPQTLCNVYPDGVKNVDGLSSEAVNSDVQIPQHILDQYAQVIKPKNKIIKKATVKTDAVFSDSGVSSESENLISDDLEETPVVSKKTNSFNSIRSNFEVTNTQNKEEFLSNRRKVLKRSVDDEYNQYFDEKSSSERLLEDSESSTSTLVGIANDSTKELLTTSLPIEGGDKNSLTDTLKKVLKQPLPPGPPPKKPPRTFAILSPDQASTSKSPDIRFDFETAKRKLRDLKVKSTKQHRSKEESKLMLAKLENALRKHESSGKIMSPRPIKKFNDSNSASNDTDTSLNDSNGSSKSTSKLTRNSPTQFEKSLNASSDSKPKDMHYMCTEILDLHFLQKGNVLNSSNASLNSSEGLHASNSFTKCLNSLNCTGNNSLGKNNSGQNYTKLGSFGNNSNRNSMTSMCCSCNFDAKSLRSSVEDITSPNVRLSTFMPTSNKNNDGLNNSHNFCEACKQNPGTHQFTCHINNCSTPDAKQPEESKSTFFVDRKSFSRNSDTKSQYGVLKKSKSQEHIYAEPYEFQRLRHEQEIRPNVSPPNKASFELKPALLRSGTHLADGFGRARDPDFTKIITNPPIQQNKDIFGNPRRLSSSNYNFEQVDIPDKPTSEYASTSLKSFQSDSNKDYNVRDYKTLELNRRSKEFNKSSTESNRRSSCDSGKNNSTLQNSGSKVKDMLMRLEGGRSSLRIVKKKDNNETSFSTGRKFHQREMNSSPIRDNDHRADEIKNDEAIERRLSYLASKIYDTPYAETPFLQRTLPKPPSDGPSSNTSFLYALPATDQTIDQTIDQTVNQPQPSFADASSADLSSKGAYKRPPMYEKKSGYLEGQSSALYRLTETPNKRNIHEVRKRRSPTEMDRENLNRLMTEIYDTVAEACILDGNTSGETDHDTGDEVSLKLTRSLTEKRKRYVRRVSSRAGFISPGSVHRNRLSNNTNTSTTGESATNISNSSSEDISNNSEIKADYKDYSTFPMRRKQTLKTPDPTDAETNPNNYMATYSSFPLRQASRVGEDAADEAVSPVSCCDYEDITQPQINKGGLFDSCILVGMNFSTGEAYIKSVFPEKTALPPRMESLVFPECSSELEPKYRAPVPAQDLQDYGLVLTNERGARSYGYCRRVLPEGASHCLPLAYCIVSRYRAPAFYYKVLQEIESRHGSSDFILNSIFTQLYNSEFPRPGQFITLKQLKSPKRIVVSDHSFQKNSTFRNSVNLGEVLKSMEDINEQNINKISNSNSSEALQPFPKDCDKFRRKSTDVSAKFPELYTKDDSIMKSLERIYGTGLREFQSVISDGNKLPVNPFEREFGGSNTNLNSASNNEYEEVKFEKVKVMNLTEERIDKEQKYRNYSAKNCLEFVNIKRPLEPRLDEDNLSVLFDSISVSVLVKIFGTLLIERKVVIVCDKLSKLSACMEGLQSILYPFTWQHVLIASIPAEIRRDMMEAPIPILCGLSQQDQDTDSLNFQEGMLVDISRSCKDSPCERVIKMQGDEASLLPPLLAKTLKASLQLGPPITSNAASDEHARKTRNVLVAEAFLRFFVELLGDYRSFFKEGTGEVEFDKEQFIKSARSKHVQYFLEWFTETAMFGNFIHQRTSLVSPAAPPKSKSSSFESEATSPIMDLPYPDFYELFDERVSRRASATKSSGNGKDGVTKGNYKMIVNKKVKVWRDKLRDLVN